MQIPLRDFKNLIVVKLLKLGEPTTIQGETHAQANDIDVHVANLSCGLC